MKTFPFILLALAALALAGCNATTVTSVASTAGIWLTKPGTPPPADTEHQIKEHESWCYETMGYAECYPQPQDVDPNRLINVDPQNLYPLTPRDYEEAVFMEGSANKSIIPVSTVPATGAPTSITTVTTTTTAAPSVTTPAVAAPPATPPAIPVPAH
jgi:hypothetical protein